MPFKLDYELGITCSHIGKTIPQLNAAVLVSGGKQPYNFDKQSGPDLISVSETGIITGKSAKNDKNENLL